MRTRVAILCLAAGCGRIGFSPGSDSADGVPYPEAVLADAPLAYYRFADPGGAIAADSSGNRHDAEYRLAGGGTIVLGRPGAVTGDADTAVELHGEGNAGDGSSAYAFIPLTVAPWGGDFSVELWLRPGNIFLPDRSNAIFQWEEYTVAGFRLGWDPAGTLRFWTTEGGGSTDVRTPPALDANAFNHIVLVRTGATVRLYVDGVEVLVSGIDYVTPDGSPDHGVGSHHGMPTDGVFDELAIYATALSPARIAAHYQAGRSL